MDVGNVIGLLVAPVLIETFGVSSVFYLFAGIGFLWVVGWPLALGKPMDALLSPNGLEVKSAPQAPEEREDVSGTHRLSVLQKNTFFRGTIHREHICLCT